MQPPRGVEKSGGLKRCGGLNLNTKRLYGSLLNILHLLQKVGPVMENLQGCFAKQGAKESTRQSPVP